MVFEDSTHKTSQSINFTSMEEEEEDHKLMEIIVIQSM